MGGRARLPDAAVNFAEAIAANQNAINLSTVPQLRRLKPVLLAAQRELAHGMGTFMRKVPGGETYTKHRHRQMLAQIQTALAIIDNRVAPAMKGDLQDQGRHTMDTGWAKMLRMIEAGRTQFEGAVTPLRLDVAASIEKPVFERFQSSAARYAGEIGSEVRSKLMLGVIRGESIDQLAGRLLASTGVTRILREQGPVAVGHGMADRVFGTMRYRANRLAATELVNAYGTVQTQAIVIADHEEPGYLKKWDAAADARTCPYCRELDGHTVKPLGYFYSRYFGRILHQPLHPFCRCAIVPWRVGWTLN